MLELPVLVLPGGTEFFVVCIPQMSDESFEFFKHQLDVYRNAIVKQQEGSRDR